MPNNKNNSKNIIIIGLSLAIILVVLIIVFIVQSGRSQDKVNTDIQENNQSQEEISPETSATEKNTTPNPPEGVEPPALPDISGIMKNSSEEKATTPEN
jgi:flagellar basal body-associated protein FliL